MIHTTRQSPKFMRLVRRIRTFVRPDCIIDADSVTTAILEKLWHATIAGAPRGDIGKFDNDCIAEMCGWMGDADQLVDLLVDCRFLDRHADHRLIVHDWHDHAPNHVKGNVTRMGGFLTIAQTTGPNNKPLGQAPGDRPNATGAPNLTQRNATQPNPTQQENSHTHTPRNQTPLMIPDGLKVPWARWCEFRLAIDGRPIDPIQADAWLMELDRRGQAKAIDDIDFSIRKGSRNILDSDNDFEKQRTARNGSHRRERVVV